MVDSVKTWGGIAVASIKTFNGIAAAAVKSLGGIALPAGGGTFATFDPAAKSARITLSNGNLTSTSDGTANVANAKSTVFKSSGKWYCEYTVGTLGANCLLGIENSTKSVDADFVSDLHAYGYRPSFKVHGGNASYGASFTSGDVIGMEFDATAGTLEFFKNGTTQGVAYTGITGSWTPTISANSTASIVTSNFGASAFARTPNAGFAGWSV